MYKFLAHYCIQILFAGSGPAVARFIGKILTKEKNVQTAAFRALTAFSLKIITEGLDGGIEISPKRCMPCLHALSGKAKNKQNFKHGNATLNLEP